MMDRKKKDDLPKMQVGFIDAICLPIYKVRELSNFFKRHVDCSELDIFNALYKAFGRYIPMYFYG